MSQFIEQCEQVAEKLGLEIVDTYEDGQGDDVFEDDGTLHIVRGKERVAFDVSNVQTLSTTTQNFNTRRILQELGIPVTKRAFV